MDKITIDNMIDKYLKELSASFKKDPGYDYLKQICSSYKLNTIDDFLSSDIYEIFKCYFYLKCDKKIPIDEVSKIVEEYRKLTADIDFLTIDTIKSINEMLIDNSIFDLGIEYLSDASLFKNKVLEMKVRHATSPRLALALTLVKDVLKDICPQLVECLKIQKTYPEIIEIYDYLKLYHDLISVIEGVKFAEEAAKEMNRKTNKKYSKEIINNSDSAKAIMNCVKCITEFIKAEEQAEKKHNKKYENEMYSLKNAMTLLRNSLKGDEVTNARVIVNGIHDEEIKYAVLKLIYEHNQKYYKSLDEKIDSLSSNSISNYSKLFGDYNVNIDGYDISVITHNSLSELDIMLKRLRSVSLTDNMILYILTFTNYDKFMEIFDYFDKKFITMEYLKSNLLVFWAESNLLDIFKGNINFLIENGVNPQMFINSSYLLFNEDENFKNNILLLKEYDLLKYLKTTNNYDFISSKDLVNKIDMLIEFGYVEFLKQDLGLLNYSSFNRLYVLKTLGEKIDTKEELISVLDSNNQFFVPDNMILSYVEGEFNKVKHDKICIDENTNLEIYRTSSRTYEIDGVVLSSHRIDRMIRDESNIFDALASDEFISNGEFSRVCDALKQKTNK